jgi:hypothetical protein
VLAVRALKQENCAALEAKANDQELKADFLWQTIKIQNFP